MDRQNQSNPRSSTAFEFLTFILQPDFSDRLLVMLGKENPININTLFGVDDDASWLRAAITNQSHVSDEVCTRIYIQGFSETNNPEIAILFDR